MSTRRRFLCLSSAALASTAVPRVFAQRQGTPVFSNASLGAYTQGSLNRAKFEGLVGSPFRVFLDGGKLATLTLLTVTNSSATRQPAKVITTVAEAGARVSHLASASPIGAGAATTSASPSASETHAGYVRPTSEQCFMVQFGTGGVVVPQDSYVVDHASLGSFTLFLVPGEEKNGGKTVTSTFYYL